MARGCRSGAGRAGGGVPPGRYLRVAFALVAALLCVASSMSAVAVSRVDLQFGELAAADVAPARPALFAPPLDLRRGARLRAEARAGGDRPAACGGVRWALGAGAPSAPAGAAGRRAVGPRVCAQTHPESSCGGVMTLRGGGGGGSGRPKGSTKGEAGNVGKVGAPQGRAPPAAPKDKRPATPTKSGGKSSKHGGKGRSVASLALAAGLASFQAGGKGKAVKRETSSEDESEESEESEENEESEESEEVPAKKKGPREQSLRKTPLKKAGPKDASDESDASE